MALLDLSETGAVRALAEMAAKAPPLLAPEAPVFDARGTTVGDCLILPADTAFTLHVPGEEPFFAMACIPVGGQATMVPDGPTFAPPWAA